MKHTRLGRQYAGYVRNLYRFLAVVCVQLIGHACIYAFCPVPPTLPPAGSEIINRACLTCTNSVSGQTFTLGSNTVRAIIQPWERAVLEQDHCVERSIGETVTLKHTLTNTGNIASSYTLLLAQTSTCAMRVLNLHLVLDQNENGQVDQGELVLMSGAIVSLAPREHLTLLVVGSLPADTAPGASAQVILTAMTQLQEFSVHNTDTIVAISAIQATVCKTVSSPTAKPNDVVTYQMTAKNTGQAMAKPLQLCIDGTMVAKVVLSDPIPANTSFVSVARGGAGVVIYHVSGADADTWVSCPPTDYACVDAVALAVPSFAPADCIDVTFTVRIHANAGGAISNVATLRFCDPTAADEGSIASNPVTVTVPPCPPTMCFFRDPRYSVTMAAIHPGAPLYLQVEAAVCNTSSVQPDMITLKLTSKLTGDIENVHAIENGPNTGVFRLVSPLPTADTPAIGNNGIMEVAVNDVITAQFADGLGSQVSALVYVDPYGVIFDSKTNLPVVGATVSLIDVSGAGNGGDAGGAATVYELDGVTHASARVVTASDGAFRFPLVLPSTYRLLVSPPNGYIFPSRMSIGALPAGRVIDLAGSYGKSFAVTTGMSTVTLDVPLDPAPATGLTLEKSASRNVAEIGDFLDFTITMRNQTGSDLTDIIIMDTLPRGMRYQRGSARSDGALTTDPTGGVGPRITFSIPAIARASQTALTYRVYLGPGVHTGTNRNQASATAMTPTGLTTSNTDNAEVDVLPGVFTTSGILIGKVFLDQNINGAQDTDEPGVPGVRLVLEDGTFTITDSAGKYSIYGLSPRAHTMKIDATTLPEGAKLTTGWNRQGGDPSTVLVDLATAQLYKANIPLAGDSDEVLREVRRRQQEQDRLLDAIEQSLAIPMTTDGLPVDGGDSRRRPASGVIGGSSGGPAASLPIGGGAQQTADNSNLPSLPVSPTPLVSLTDRMLSMENTVGFVDLHDGDTLPQSQTTIIVKGQAGGRFLLVVNGTEIATTQVGMRHLLPEKNLLAWEYIGVALRPGENQLTLTELAESGAALGESVQITVIAPGMMSTIHIATDGKEGVADGKSIVPIDVTIVDAHGTPVTARTPVTLEASLGAWQVDDLDPVEPGTQTFIEDGTARFPLQAPPVAGASTVRITSGVLSAQAIISFLPELRPLLAAGIIEGTVHARSGHNDGDDAFSLTDTAGGQSGNTNGRVAFYLKGKIKGSTLLTLAYDSEKESKQRLFRDIQPDEFYPVYGDASVKGFDAQSSQALYVRVDRGYSYLLYGDYVTNGDNTVVSLGAYNRSLTGFQTHYAAKRASLNLFASYDDLRRSIEEIPANGTSGPYRLSSDAIVQNSEIVEILTRDRNQPSVVLKTVTMTRFYDYTVDFLTGGILFNAPVASVDENLNPISIRVTYDVEQGGKNFWITGIQGCYSITPERLMLGGNWIDDDNPQAKYGVRSLNATWCLSPTSTVMTEYARTQSDAFGSGNGARIEFQQTTDRLTARVAIGKTDDTFDNPSASQTRGRVEVNAKGTYLLDWRTRVQAEALHTEDRLTGGIRDGIQGSIERAISNNLRVELGIRHATESQTPSQPTSIGGTPVDFTSLRAKVTATLPHAPQATAYGEYELDIHDPDKRVAALGGEYQFANRGRLYARHEFTSSLSGRYALNDNQTQQSTIIGIDTDYVKNAHVFSEYRVNDAFSGRETEAAIGLRNQWPIAPGVRVNTTFERILPMTNGLSTDATAITGAIEYTRNPHWKGTARVEWRNNSGGNGLLSSIGAAYKLTPSWTFLGRGLLNSTNGNINDTNQNRVQLGLAYRPTTTDAWNALMKYEFRQEDASDTEHSAHILSGDLNYQPSARFMLTQHLATKWSADNSAGIQSQASAYLLGDRLTWYLSPRWDASVLGSVLWGDGARQYGLGGEVGCLLKENLWLTAGYNIAGYHDDDLAGENSTEKGLYLRLRLKFDEKLLQSL